MKVVVWIFSVAVCHGFHLLTKPVVLRFSQSKETVPKIRSGSRSTELTMRFVPLTAARWQIPSAKVQIVLAAHVVVVAAVLSILRFLLGHLIKFIQEMIKTKRAPKDRVTLVVDEKRKTEEQEKARLAAWKKRQEAEIVELRARLRQPDDVPASTNVRGMNAAKKRELAVIEQRKRHQAMMLARPMDGLNAAQQQELAVIAQRKLQQDMMARDHLSSTREEEAEKNRKLTSMMVTAERDAKRLTESALANVKAKLAEVVEQRLKSEEKEEELRYAQEWAAAASDNTAGKIEDELQAQGEWASGRQRQPEPILIAIANEMNDEQQTVATATATAIATTASTVSPIEGEKKKVETKEENEKKEEEKIKEKEKFQLDMDNRLRAAQVRELAAFKKQQEETMKNLDVQQQLQQQQQHQQLQQQQQQQQQQKFQQERALEEKQAFERYRQERLDQAKRLKETATLKWEAAREELQQAEDEREEQRKKEEASMVDQYPLVRLEEIDVQPSLLSSPVLTPTSISSSAEPEVDIVAFRPAVSSSTALAILSPEERAKMELSAAIVTLSAIGLKFGGPLGAVAFASAAKVYGEQGSAQGSFVRGLGKFAIGSVELVQSVNLKFGIGQAIDNAVLNLIQNSVEAVNQEADKDTIMMNELRITQQYDRVKNLATRSVNISQEMVEDSIQLLDRVVENVKKVES